MTIQQRVPNSGHALEERGQPAASRLRERLLAGQHVAERRLRLAGVSTAILAGGGGPPLVLLHGSGEFAALWMRVIPDLAEVTA